VEDISIGTRVAELRKAKGVTQEVLARAIGVTGQAVSKWESGGSPDIALLPGIADFFGVAIDKLFGRENTGFDDTEAVVTRYIAAPFDEHQANGQTILELSEIPDDILNSMFERCNRVCWSVLFGMMGTRIYEELNLPHHSFYDTLVAHAKDSIGFLGHISFNRGMILASAAPAAPFFLLLPEPKEGWRGGLASPQEYTALFSALGDADVLHGLMVLHTKEASIKFTLGYLMKEAQFNTEQAERVAAKLEELKILKSSHIELDDTRRPFYEFKPNEAFIALLILAQTVVRPPVHAGFHAADRKAPLLHNGSPCGKEGTQ
jgi:transcriptional regulator with XRE-family HTH domain